MTEAARWRAVAENDSRFDGVFVYAVPSTGIFCRPSCPSRLPRRETVRYFQSSELALQAGFRPCKRCRPDLLTYDPGRETAEEAAAILVRYSRDQEALEQALDNLGISRRRLGALFRIRFGTTISAYLTDLRVADACRQLRETPFSVGQIAVEVGFGSLSAFYRSFREQTGCAPADYRRDARKKEEFS